MTRVPVTLGLGSNLGDKAENIHAAVERLRHDRLIEDLTLSSLYRTAPWGDTDQDWFVNACAAGVTECEPLALLHSIKAIETDLGRAMTRRWGPRVIDIDLLTYGDVTMAEPELVLPHKDMLDRAFVLIPLAEIRPRLCVRGIAVAARAAELDGGDVVRLEPSAPA